MKPVLNLDDLEMQPEGYAVVSETIGATLYEMLTGKPPFEGVSVMNVVNAVLTKAPVSPRQLRPGIDRDLETICLKCLEKEPEQRYGSAQELADDLGRYLRDEPIVARRPGALRRAWKWTRRNRKLAGLLALTAALGVIASGGFLERRWALHRQAERIGEILRDGESGGLGVHDSPAYVDAKHELASYRDPGLLK